MSKQLRKLASALMDVEVSIEEFDAVSSQPVQIMISVWRRYYQAISSVNYGRRAFADGDISDRVHRHLLSLDSVL